MSLSILLAEDEEQLSRVYTAALEHQGYRVDQVYNGQDAVKKANDNVYDVFILDIMMPVKTGLEALREIRANGDSTHAIMLTAMSEIEDKVTGLEAGADDYLTKPISLKELLARMASLERRLDSFTDKILTLGSVKLDIAQQEMAASNSIRLAGKESKLMAFFMLNPNKSLSTREIFQHVWAKDDDPEIDEGYVFIYVSYLRQKLKSIKANLAILGKENGDFTLVETAGDDYAS
ncbi:response regulator transcription factor [Streptococcus ratti]|uniref:Response regulator n=1 Tax=Streptococcus ratti FA-1 = DSM 20564 TaxID=699248 RepID=A0ABP2QXM4_STRRT|nr:response regulator transcription factor [Streptococcus ratti]EJN93787.1 putative response regulator [Streptococcus ratti FA-1 = DSM 20564]EMP70745.1 putative response regulator [Streptococcus ratti FA-1 = DSM 20564]QEY07639.1 response regulator transcription factor [Streptococcus ratti]VEI60099.1 response regulator [Streptococcus mutans]